MFKITFRVKDHRYFSGMSNNKIKEKAREHCMGKANIEQKHNNKAFSFKSTISSCSCQRAPQIY